MLYDTLENLNQYRGMFENLDAAIDYIEENGLDELPLGKTEIDGEKLFVTVQEVETLPAEGRSYETHSRYMALHADLSGAELCEVALGPVSTVKAYDEETDTALWKGDTSAALVLDHTRFAVFMAEEPHLPAIRAEGCSKVKKAVFMIEY